jgi:hypothetical protein
MQTSEIPGDQPNKVTRDNCARHLVEKELEMVGKTMMDTLDDMEWYSNITMTRVQHEEFKKYSIGVIKKIFKVNTRKAEDIFNWFDLAFGLRVKN